MSFACWLHFGDNFCHTSLDWGIIFATLNCDHLCHTGLNWGIISAKQGEGSLCIASPLHLCSRQFGLTCASHINSACASHKTGANLYNLQNALLLIRSFIRWIISILPCFLIVVILIFSELILWKSSWNGAQFDWSVIECEGSSNQLADLIFRVR